MRLRSRSRNRRSGQIQDLESRALLSAITVTSLGDTTDANDGVTTLREALEQAEWGDEIEFAEAGRIVLREGALTTEKAVTIVGLGPDQTIIDALGASRVVGGYVVALRDLTLTGGRSGTRGGAIDADVVIADNVHFTNNEAGTGGAIHANGVTVTDSTFIGNVAKWGGGAIWQREVVGHTSTVTNSVFHKNTAGTFGGAIYRAAYNDDVVRFTVTGSTFTENSAQVGGAVADVSLIEDSTFIRNSAVNGGAVSSREISVERPGQDLRTTVRSSTFIENSATGDGGAQYQGDTTTTSTFVGNVAAGRGGAIFGAEALSFSTVIGNQANLAGGVHVDWVSDSIVAGNTVGGEPWDISIGYLNSVKRTLIGSNAHTPFEATGSTPNEYGNLVGDNDSLLDPMLLPLGDYGGPTSVMPPRTGSPVHELAGSSTDVSLDQHGNVRQADVPRDAGSMEGIIASAVGVSDVSVSEGTGGTREMTFHVTHYGTSSPFSLSIATQGGTATDASGDYTAIDRTLNFTGTDGEVQTVTVTISPDDVEEPTEDFLLVITSISDPAIVVVSDGVGTIRNDDVREGVFVDDGVLYVRGTPGADVITLENVGDNVKATLNGESMQVPLSGLHKFELVGFGGNDTITATDILLPSFIAGGSGHDTIVGGEFSDTVSGGGGNDSIDGGPGHDALTGGSGRDTVVGDTGNDSLRGSAGNDHLFGDGGADQIEGGAGQDQILGGGGDDVLYGGDFDGGSDSADTISGEAGDDTLRGHSGNDSLSGGDGDDWVDGQDGADIVEGNDGDDSLEGGFGNDLLDGAAGNDILKGDTTDPAGGGRDTLLGGDGNDVLYGGNNADELSGGIGSDTLYGGNGIDVLYGNGGSDALFGEGSSDVLVGGSGRDVLFGGKGKDTMSGGQGDDLVIGGRARDSASNGKVLVAWTRWKRNDSYADRAAGVELILRAPVSNDGAVDELIGGSDLDYFFVTQGTDDDDVFSLGSGETFGEI